LKQNGTIEIIKSVTDGQLYQANIK